MQSRILFLTERYPPDPGGVSTSASRIAAALADLPCEVDVVTWTRSLPAGRVEAAEGNPAVYRIGRYREWDSTMPHTMNLLDWLSMRNCYSAVWGHYLPVAGFAAVWFGRLRAVPSIVSVRGNDLDRDVFAPSDFARLEWTLRNADLVAAVTLELAKKVTALAGREDVVHLPNAVDTDVFRPGPPDPELRAALGIQDGEAVLGFAGELREKKGLQHLLDALRHVRQQRPACLLIIGDVRPSEMPRVFQILGPGSLAGHRVLDHGTTGRRRRCEPASAPVRRFPSAFALGRHAECVARSDVGRMRLHCERRRGNPGDDHPRRRGNRRTPLAVAPAWGGGARMAERSGRGSRPAESGGTGAR